MDIFKGRVILEIAQFSRNFSGNTNLSYSDQCSIDFKGNGSRDENKKNKLKGEQRHLFHRLHSSSLIALPDWKLCRMQCPARPEAATAQSHGYASITFGNSQ